MDFYPGDLGIVTVWINIYRDFVCLVVEVWLVRIFAGKIASTRRKNLVFMVDLYKMQTYVLPVCFLSC